MKLYVDGQLRQTKTLTVNLPNLIKSLQVANIGHSPYGGDVIMEHALFDDLQIFDSALSPLQVEAIAENATSMHDDVQFEGIADIQDFENLVAEVKNYYVDADNAALTQAYNNSVKALSIGNDKRKLQSYQQLQEAVHAYQEEQLQLARTEQPANLTFLIRCQVPIPTF